MAKSLNPVRLLHCLALMRGPLNFLHAGGCLRLVFFRATAPPMEAAASPTRPFSRRLGAWDCRKISLAEDSAMVKFAAGDYKGNRSNGGRLGLRDGDRHG